MVEQVEKASFCHHGLVKLPGGLAAQSNLDEFKRLIEEKERAAQKCKQIRKLADPDVELALKARMRGGLKEELEVETWQRFRQFCRQDSLDLCCFCVCFDLDVCYPHHCVRFLFFALHPPRPRPRPPALPPLITSHSSQHNSSHHLSQPPRHTAFITALLIASHSSDHNSSQLHFSHLTHHTTTHHSSTYCTTYHISLITPQLITAPLLTPHSSHHNFWRSSLHHLSHLTHHATTHHSSTSHTSLITASLLEELLLAEELLRTSVHRAVHRAAWQSFCVHGRRWAAAGCHATGAVHRAVWRSCCARGRRWAAAGCRVAGAVHRAVWGSCCWAAAGCRVAGAVHRALLAGLLRAWSPMDHSWLSCGRRSTQSPPGGAAARIIADGPRLAVVWRGQYTEPSGGAAATSSHTIFHTPSFTPSFPHHFVTHNL